MADNLNNGGPDNNQDQNPFDHPIKKNNWWMYILGGLCFAGLIIWFFINWSYKDRNKYVEPEASIEVNKDLPVDVVVPTAAPTDSTITVDSIPAE